MLIVNLRTLISSFILLLYYWSVKATHSLWVLFYQTSFSSYRISSVPNACCYGNEWNIFAVCLCLQVNRQRWKQTVMYASLWLSFRMILSPCHQIPMLQRRNCPSAKDRSLKYESRRVSCPESSLFLDLTSVFTVSHSCLQVYGDKDADGFYRGESGGRLGYVPCNMVSEIQVEDEETRQQLLQQGFLSTAASIEKIGMWHSKRCSLCESLQNRCVVLSKLQCLTHKVNAFHV